MNLTYRTWAALKVGTEAALRSVQDEGVENCPHHVLRDALGYLTQLGMKRGYDKRYANDLKTSAALRSLHFSLGETYDPLNAQAPYERVTLVPTDAGWVVA